MIDLSRPSESTSKDHELSDDELRSFAVDTLSRLITQNIFDALLAATVRAMSTIHGAEETSASVRQLLDAATSELTEEIKTLVLTVALNNELTAVLSHSSLHKKNAASGPVVPSPGAPFSPRS